MLMKYVTISRLFRNACVFLNLKSNSLFLSLEQGILRNHNNADTSFFNIFNLRLLSLQRFQKLWRMHVPTIIIT